MHPYSKHKSEYSTMDINESHNCLAIVSAAAKTTQESGFM